MTQSEQHVVIIGGGPGGCAAALAARKVGLQVTLVERDQLGGTCLNRGCIPTKTILSSARVMQDIRRAQQFAITASDKGALDGCSIDLPALRMRKSHIVDTLRVQLEAQCKRAHVHVVAGDASIADDFSIRIERGEENGSDAEHIMPDALIIASGSVPHKLPFLDFDRSRIWTSDEALALDEIPDELVVMGGGVIGVELATAYAIFGSRVTIVELAHQILPYSDVRTARTVARALKDLGIVIHTKTGVTEALQNGERVSVTLSDESTIETDILLCAVGRSPVVPHGFESGKRMPYPVEIIGDAAGGIMLAHAAEAEGEDAIRRIAAALQKKSVDQIDERVLDISAIPACVYTHPEVASIGITADEAKSRGIDAVSGIAKFTGNGMACAENETDGFVSLVVQRPSGSILGAQIVGPHAVELIAQVTLAMKSDISVFVLTDTVFAHPTVSETIKSAALIAREAL